MPAETPAFFREGGGLIAHCAQDPDVAKNRNAPMVSDREAPEHYIDLELLQGCALPPRRSEFLKLCADLVPIKYLISFSNRFKAAPA